MKRKERIEQLKRLSSSDLESRLKGAEDKLVNLAFDKNLRKVKDTTLFKKLRKERAQIKTFLKAKQEKEKKEHAKKA